MHAAIRIHHTAGCVPGHARRPDMVAADPELVSDALLDKFSLVGTPEKNAERIQWLFANGVYPIIYPLPRRERMVEDHHSVLEQVSRWAQVLEAASPDR